MAFKGAGVKVEGAGMEVEGADVAVAGAFFDIGGFVSPNASSWYRPRS